MIYLDTHIAVWLYEAKLNKFSSQIQKLMELNDLLISGMVQLELQYLYDIRRLNKNSESIVKALRAEIGLEICPTPLSTIAQFAIYETWTRDPFDRIIVANARCNNAILIRADEAILTNYKLGKW